MGQRCVALHKALDDATILLTNITWAATADTHRVTGRHLLVRPLSAGLVAEN